MWVLYGAHCLPNTTPNEWFVLEGDAEVECVVFNVPSYTKYAFGGEVDHRVCTRDAMGTSSMTSLLLEVNLWSLKLPLIHSSVLFLISLIASCTVGIDLSPSST